jgi:hypothetical protein
MDEGCLTSSLPTAIIDIEDIKKMDTEELRKPPAFHRGFLSFV